MAETELPIKVTEMNILMAVPLTENVALKTNVYSLGVKSSSFLQFAYAFLVLPFM